MPVMSLRPELLFTRYLSELEPEKRLQLLSLERTLADGEFFPVFGGGGVM